MDGKRCVVTVGSERVTIYPQGGTCYGCKVPGIGWVVDDEPSEMIMALGSITRDAWLLTLTDEEKQVA